MWDPKAGSVRRHFSVNDSSGFVVFSPDGKLLALQGKQGIALAETATDKVVRTLEGHKGAPHAVAFSPDGKRLASVSWDGTLRLWNVATGELQDLVTERGGRFRDVKFAPDGLSVVTASEDGTVRIWDVRPGVKAVKREANPQ